MLELLDITCRKLCPLGAVTLTVTLSTVSVAVIIAVQVVLKSGLALSMLHPMTAMLMMSIEYVVELLALFPRVSLAVHVTLYTPLTLLLVTLKVNKELMFVTFAKRTVPLGKTTCAVTLSNPDASVIVALHVSFPPAAWAAGTHITFVMLGVV